MKTMIFKADTKQIRINKTNYGLVNNMLIESYLMRIDTKNYDVKIIERDNQYIINISLKSSIGSA